MADSQITDAGIVNPIVRRVVRQELALSPDAEREVAEMALCDAIVMGLACRLAWERAETARLRRALAEIKDYAATASLTSRNSVGTACDRLAKLAGDAAEALNSPVPSNVDPREET